VSAFVHGVVPAEFEPPALRGLGDPAVEVHMVRAGELAALVSDLPEGPRRGTRADLEAHARVLSETVDRGAAVIPVRFGMVLDDEDAVRERLLTHQRDHLLELLRSLDGAVQVTLKAMYAEGVLLRDVAEADPRIARLSEATRDRPDAAVHREKVHLGELVAAGIEHQRAADERAVLDRVAPVAEQVIAEEPRHERIAAHAQLLVRRDRLGELDETVGELDAEQGGRLTFRLVGPLPAWSFADLRLDPQEATWA
jgi:hypothetical protein